MRTPSLTITAVLSAAYLIVTACVIVALPWISEAAPTSQACPGPLICGKSCSLDAFGTPIYCSDGQCVCPPGYDTEAGPPLLCQPHQPEFMGSSSDVAACPGSCTSTPWAIAGGISNAFDIVAVHGTSPGGEAFMPVWGYQANNCGVHGVPATDADGNPILDANGNPIRSWAGCTPNPGDICFGLQDIDEADFDPPSCDPKECASTGFCTSDFTSAWPYLDNNFKCVVGALACPHDLCQASDFCEALSGSAHYACKVICIGCFIQGVTDPSRIDFANNVSVYRAPIAWETKSDEGLDDDYDMNLHSPGGELYDTQHADARVHVEFDSDETIDHFTGGGHDFGTANKWWSDLRTVVDRGNDQDVQTFMRSFVNPPGDHDPMAVVVGVPGIDCADHPDANTVELHPAYAVAIRIQERCPLSAGLDDCPNPQPEQWTFFYRNSGNNGGCGSKTYGRCGTTFQLPLSLPGVPSGKVLKSADVHVDAHPWAVDDSSPSGVTVDGHFDLANGTVLTVTLPAGGEGVVGLVTVTPVVDTTPPTITCPGNITTPPDLGKCTAVATFTPTVSDDCSVMSTVCSPPSGTAFPIGMTTDTCAATDQAGLSASCSFTVTVTAGNKCPLGQGYWKNHTNPWAVNSLTLGSVTYTQAQLISILNSPTKGDASVILAKQLIAALLDLANGSDPVPVCGTIADANSALDGCTVPCGTSPNSPTGQAMISDANSLDNYNGGGLTAGCTP